MLFSGSNKSAVLIEITLAICGQVDESVIGIIALRYFVLITTK